MSGWSMINLEVTGDSDVREQFRERTGEFADEGLQKAAHKQVNLSAEFLSSVRYHGTVVVRISGYREWGEDKQFARSLYPELWDRCVIIQANDTADLGEARLYELDGNQLEQVDRFAEEELTHGRFVGDLAAAKMFAKHNLPCLGDFSHPFEFSKQSGEWCEDKLRGGKA